jgi:hypothetical protein
MDSKSPIVRPDPADHPLSSPETETKRRFKEREYQLQETLRLTEAEFGPSDPDTLDARLQLGFFYGQDGLSLPAEIREYEILYSGIPVSREFWAKKAYDIVKVVPGLQTRLLALGRSLRAFQHLPLYGSSKSAPSYGLLKCLVEIALPNHPNLAEYLPADQANTHPRYWRNLTLVRAIQKDHVAFATLLLARGADKNAKDDAGNSVLAIATWENNSDLMRLLYREGAVLSGPDPHKLSMSDRILVKLLQRPTKLLNKASERIEKPKASEDETQSRPSPAAQAETSSQNRELYERHTLSIGDSNQSRLEHSR